MIQYKKRNITVFQSSLYMTTSAVIHTDNAIVMTDPNWLPSEVETIKHYVDEMKGNKDLYIIYTHSDFDHIIGSGAFPNAKVITTESFQKNPYKEETIQKIHHFDQGYYLERGYNPEYPTSDFVVTHDGENITLGDLTLTFYLAPGHTNDSLFTVIEPCGIFLSGDYLSDVEFPFIFSSYTDYVATIDKTERVLEQHNIKVHIPGHGVTTENQEEIQHRLTFSKFYLDQLLNDTGKLKENLRKKYRFFEGVKGIHSDNKALAKQEITKSN